MGKLEPDYRHGGIDLFIGTEHQRQLLPGVDGTRRQRARNAGLVAEIKGTALLQ